MVVPARADVVIVGAGAAGCLIAARLAAAGRDVVVLEAGPPWTMADLASSQIWARRLKWGGAPVEFRGNHRGFGHNVNTGWGFGGAALHHYATWPRMHEAAFADWPFGYDTLRPHYDRVQAEVGVSGDAAAEIWRPPGAPYPLPPMRRFAQGDILARGFAALGHPVAPLPAAILTADYGERPACVYDGWCDAGCPIGALGNPLAVHMPKAEAAGATFVSGATVTRLLRGSGGRIARVEYAQDGKLREIAADAVVLAASAVQNPRILLNSGFGGTVGQGFMLDAVVLMYGLFDRPTENHMGVSAGHLMNRVRGRVDRPDAPEASWQWQIAPSLKPNDIFGIAVTRAELFGDKLHGFMRDAAKHLANMVAMIEQPREAANRVALSDQRDAFGMKLARVEHRFSDATMRVVDFVRSEGAAVMRAAGAREHWHGPFNAGHMIGGTTISDDPAASVADRWGKVHAAENLWLAGSGLFPASGGVSPTFTLLAVADRTAARLTGA